jgi:hypothetical protein
MLMNSKTGIAFSIVAIAAVIVLFASGPLAATQAQANEQDADFFYNTIRYQIGEIPDSCFLIIGRTA